ncbi:MAG TPA: hypothetical protein VH593_01005 [Ktedonobacteraceae bacterium]
MEPSAPLRTDRAHTLGKAMLEASQALKVAHEKYQHSLAIVMDTEVNADGMLALRNEGRAYAAAIMDYSRAAMAWLVFVDTHLHAN